VATVLLCGDETPATLGSARALRVAGHVPWVAVAQEGTYVSRSRTVAGCDLIPDPYGHPAEATARAIAAIAARRGAGVVLPATEAALRALTGREHLFEPGVVVGTAPVGALDIAVDKVAVGALASAAGLDSLPSVEVSAADMNERADDLPLPGVAKARSSVSELADGSLSLAGTHLVDDVESVRRVVEARPEIPWLVQRRVSGTLAAIGGVAWQGRLVCAVHQVSLRIWPPEAGITAFAVTVEPDEGRERALERLLGEIGWSGVFGLQFLLAEGHAYPIDFNPRIYGSISLAIAAGLNLPAIWTDLLLGREPDVGAYRVGVGYRTDSTDARALLAAWRSGGRAEALRGALPRRRTAHAVFSLRDPWPAAAAAGALLSRVAHR
jgi:hypothetical protein